MTLCSGAVAGMLTSPAFSGTWMEAPAPSFSLGSNRHSGAPVSLTANSTFCDTPSAGSQGKLSSSTDS